MNICVHIIKTVPGNLSVPWGVAFVIRRGSNHIDPQEMFQVFDGMLFIGDDLFDDIANGDHSDEPGIFNHGQVAQMFGVDAVSAMLPDPVVALRVAADRGRLGDLVPIEDGPGGCAAVVEKDVVAGPNDTFRFHWLFADMSGRRLGNVVTVVLLHRQSARPLPVALQRRYESQLLGRERVPVDEMPLIAGIRHSWNFREWTADTGSRPWLAIPVAAPEWGEVKAVFVSIDGGDFFRMPL